MIELFADIACQNYQNILILILYQMPYKYYIDNTYMLKNCFVLDFIICYCKFNTNLKFDNNMFT